MHTMHTRDAALFVGFYCTTADCWNKITSPTPRPFWRVKCDSGVSGAIDFEVGVLNGVGNEGISFQSSGNPSRWREFDEDLMVDVRRCKFGGRRWMYSKLIWNIDEVYRFSLTKFGVVIFIDSCKKSNNEIYFNDRRRFSARRYTVPGT